MNIQLTDKGGFQIMALQHCSFDADINGEKDFQISMDVSDYDQRIQPGCRVFIPETEIGGVLGEPQADSGTNTISILGHTWRGRLNKKVITPPEGQDFYIVEGEVNGILKELIEPRFSGLFKVPGKDTGISVRYQFDRFCTLYDGVVKMLKSVGMRLKIVYNQGRPNSCGWVDIEAVPVVDYSEEIELSQDSRLNFSITEKYDGVTHLIVGGKGELQERNVIHLYVQKDGSIGKEKYYTGIDEVEEFYENTSTDTAELEKAGTERLKERMNYKSFLMDVESLDIDVAIGDIIGGRDHITGMYVAKPLENIIVTINDGIISIICCNFCIKCFIKVDNKTAISHNAFNDISVIFTCDMGRPGSSRNNLHLLSLQSVFPRAGNRSFSI